MFSLTVRRAQVDLVVHRSWLRTFLVESQVRKDYHNQAQDIVNRPQRRTFFNSTQAQDAASQPLRIRRTKNRKPPSKPWSERGFPKPEPLTPTEKLIASLHDAIESESVDHVITAYRALSSESLSQLTHGTTFRLAQFLHEALRKSRRPGKGDASSTREEIERLVAFAEIIVLAIRKETLPASTRAHVHLLSLFKEAGTLDAGVNFWKFLELQDDSYVNADVYGAAIELLAVAGSSLPELEMLYQQALTRCPGNAFASYHLSPSAILPSRTAATNIKGIPVALLQGILTARLLRSDPRNAYLALDTSLRLYPDQTLPRFYTLFMDERPLDEAYAVFAIACRAGSTPPYSSVRTLLTSLRTSSDLSSASTHFAALRAMLSAIYLYVSVDGKIAQNLLNELLIAISQILRIRGITFLPDAVKQEIVTATLNAVRQTIDVLSRFGGRPGLSAFNSIITNLGGWGKSKNVITTVLTDLQAMDLEPNNITRRSVLTAAGLVQDAGLIEASWEGLVTGRAARGEQLDSTDWYILIKACNGSEATQTFAREVLKGANMEEKRKAQLDESIGSMQPRSEKPVGESEEAELSDVVEGLKLLTADITALDERTQTGDIKNLSGRHLPMTLTPTPALLNTSDETMKSIYDSLTTDPSAAPDALTSSIASTEGSTTSAASIPLSPTSIPLDEMRYENWKSLNYLLSRAEENDRAYATIVDAAIAQGIAPPGRSGAKIVLSGRGISDDEAEMAEQGPVEGIAEDVKKEILRLRGVVKG